MEQVRDHGGNLDEAIALFGGTSTDWLDLSTGINPEPYPVLTLPSEVWTTLPSKARMLDLSRAAATAYDTCARVTPINGAQGGIQMVPWLRPPGHAAVLVPTYNEHAATLRASGWQVVEVSTIAALSGADLAVVVNPNNPDGRCAPPEVLRQLSHRVGLLIVDESFADPKPETSIAANLDQDNIVVLRSFGKFYGLAGLRLGFALANGGLADLLAGQAGPWPVSGPAIEIASRALLDHNWQTRTKKALQAGAERLDTLASSVGWQLVGGTSLFRTYEASDSAAAQEALAKNKVWSRIFPYSSSWIRLGLPPQDRWKQLERAFATIEFSERR